MAHSYTWRGGASLAVRADWTDLTSGANPATVLPGAADAVTVGGPSAGVLSIGGALTVASFAVTGGVALTGAVATGTLTVAGTLALAAGATLSASAATLAGGALAASGVGTLAAIAGTLSLTGDASAQGGAVITAGAITLANGTLELDGLSAIAIGAAPAQAGTLSVGAGAVLSGNGRLMGAVADAGTIAALGGVLSIFGPVDGGGTLLIGAGATLFAAGAVGAGITVAFAGTGGVLELFTTAAAFAGSIVGFAPRDAIDIASATITSAAWAAGVLMLTATDGTSLALALTGIGGGAVFVPLPDGFGGTLVLLAPSPVAPPTSGNVTLSAASLVLLGGGAGHADSLTVGGTVAVSGSLVTTRLSQTGTVAVLGGASLVVGTASVSTAGVLLGEGGGCALTVSGRLTLGGTMAAFAGAVAGLGTLALAGGTLTLDAASSIAIGGAPAETGLIAVAAGSILAGYGRIAGALDVAGMVQAQDGALTLVGPVGGGGSLFIGVGATLTAFAPVSVAVGFAASATLALFGPAAGFTGTLTGFVAGDALDVGYAAADSAVWTAGTLSLLAAGSVVAALSIAGDYTGRSWRTAADGGGGGPLTVTGTLTVAANLVATGAAAGAGAVVAMAGGTLTVGTLSLAAGAGLNGHGTVAGAVADGGGIVASGGVLTVTGPIAGAGAVSIGGGATLYAPGGIAAGMAVAFAGSGGTLELFGSAGLMLATVERLAAGNAIDIADAAITAAVYVSTSASLGTLGLTSADGDLGNIQLAGAYPGYGVATLPDGRGGTLISLVPCFVAGTLIATPDGEIPVEALRVGGLVLTPAGPRPLCWVARRHCDARAAPELRPVRVRAGALGGGLPKRDLLLSPQHALHLRGALVPAVALVNATTIIRAPAECTTYHHIGLATHSTVLADGVAAETWLPVATSATFDIESGTRPLPALPCAVRLDGGAALEALRRHLFGPPPPVHAPGRLLGHVERMVHENGGARLEGWAMDDADPARPVTLPVHRNGAVCAVAVANIWRPDLDRAGLAGGRCAFRVRIAGPSRGLSLRRAGDLVELPMRLPA